MFQSCVSYCSQGFLSHNALGSYPMKQLKRAHPGPAYLHRNHWPGSTAPASVPLVVHGHCDQITILATFHLACCFHPRTSRRKHELDSEGFRISQRRGTRNMGRGATIYYFGQCSLKTARKRKNWTRARPLRPWDPPMFANDILPDTGNMNMTARPPVTCCTHAPSERGKYRTRRSQRRRATRSTALKYRTTGYDACILQPTNDASIPEVCSEFFSLKQFLLKLCNLAFKLMVYS